MSQSTQRIPSHRELTALGCATLPHLPVLSWSAMLFAVQGHLHTAARHAPNGLGRMHLAYSRTAALQGNDGTLLVVDAAEQLDYCPQKHGPLRGFLPSIADASLHALAGIARGGRSPLILAAADDVTLRRHLQVSPEELLHTSAFSITSGTTARELSHLVVDLLEWTAVRDLPLWAVMNAVCPAPSNTPA